MIEVLQLAFMQRALMAGLLMGIPLSLLGVFVVLRRSAFFGDAVAHFSFAGIAIGFLLNVNPIAAAVATSLVLSLGMVKIQHRAPQLALDTIIGVFFSGAAALGIFVIGLLDEYRVDLFQFLFGDIVAVSMTDVVYSIVIFFLIVATLLFTWKPFFKITFNEEMAAVTGTKTKLYDYIFLSMVAVATAMAIRIVGIILVPALLVIPAATAKNISGSFKMMVLLSVVFSIVSVVTGLFGSFYLNTASGATIVLTSVVLFLISLFLRKK